MTLPPWNLGGRDSKTAVDTLLAGEMPNEMNASKCWMLGNNQNWSKPRLYALADLLGNSKGVSDVAEDQHVSASVTLKFRPEITEDGLLTRSFVHTVSRFLPTESDSQKEVTRLSKTVKRLERRNPAKAGPRQIYCGELSHLAKKWKGQGREIAPNAHTTVIKTTRSLGRT